MDTKNQSIVFNDLRILVVEDNENHQKLENLRVVAGRSVVLARSFSEAVDLMNTDIFDVLLTSLVMQRDEMYSPLHTTDYEDQDLPLGMVLALKAVNLEIPYIGILSDQNKNNSPIVNALQVVSGDQFPEPQGGPVINELDHCQQADGSKDWLKALKRTLYGYGIFNDYRPDQD